jgi:hypothetical protein
MPLVCPQCKQAYEQQNMCPLCNVVLLYHANMQSEPTSVYQEDEPSQWQQTPWGKILVGLILAQGLGHGLKQLLMAGFLVGGDGSDVWGTLWGLVLLHAVNAFGLLVGGALTGAGQRRGLLYGALVGMANGALSLVFASRNSEATGLVTLVEPLLHVFIGAIGGALGMLVWRPAPLIPEIEGISSTPVPQAGLGLDFLFAGPIHVGRVCTGAMFVVVGVVWARAILEFLLRASQGTLNVSSHLQAQLVTMEISGLVALLGAAFAGATTTNGLKQGLCVGLGASVVVLGMRMTDPKFSIDAIILTLSGIVSMTLVGGWFGAKLFPPLIGKERRRSLSYYS